MNIGGVSIILILGIFNLFLLAFQLASGMHWLKVSVRVHRMSGIMLVVSGSLHASLAFLAGVL